MIQQRPGEVMLGDHDDMVTGADVVDGHAGTGRYGAGTASARAVRSSHSAQADCRTR
jgi:hypothetical protein